MIKRGHPRRYPIRYINYQPDYPNTMNQDKKKNIDKTKILVISCTVVLIAIIISLIVINGFLLQ